MTDNRDQAGLLGRTWRYFLEISEAAVAIHYDAPWRQADSLLKRLHRCDRRRIAGTRASLFSVSMDGVAGRGYFGIPARSRTEAQCARHGVTSTACS
jgi:hypothetical protein